MNVRVRPLLGLRAVPASEPAEADLALINERFSPHPITAEDIHVRQARVAHNQYDRTLERFPKLMLERFAETLPGKSLLPGHRTGELPLGRWFRGDVRGRTEEFPVLERQGKSLEPGEKGRPAEIVPGFKPERTRVSWLEGAFYFTNDPGTELFRKNIDTGVYQDVSIGFAYDDVDCDICKTSYWRSGQCPHYRGQVLEDGTIVTLTYSGDPEKYEAMETSIVYLGAQQHAELTKQIREGRIDPQALATTHFGMDYAALKEYEALARIHGHQQKSWHFPNLKVSSSVGGEMPSLGGKDHNPASIGATGGEQMNLLEKLRKLFGLSDTATDEEVLKAAERAKADAAPLESRDEYKQLREKADAAAPVVKALESLPETLKEQLKSLSGAELVEALKRLGAVGAKALADMQETYVGHCIRLEQDEAEAKDLAEWCARTGDLAAYDALKSRVDGKWKAVCEKYPAGLSGDPTATADKPKAEAPKSYGPQADGAFSTV